MNLNDKTTMITESAVIVTLMTIFVFLGLYLMPIILFLYPIPFVILGVRHNVKSSMVTMLASFILVAILIDPLTSVFVTVMLGLLAIILPFMINREYSSYNIIVVGTLGSFLSIATTLIVSGYVVGVKFYDMLKLNFDSILNTQKNLLNEMDLSSYQVEEMIDIFSQGFDYTLLIFPTVLILFSLFNTYINYWISAAVLKRLKYKDIKVPIFSNFRLPSNIILGIAVIGIGASIINYYKLFYYDTITLNIYVLAMFIFFLQGLAVIMYLLNKTKIRSILKGFIIGILVLSGGLMPIIALIGLVDTIFDFRRKKGVN
ncbi:YybS family protein [Clostridium sp. D2Q-11]|uniref:YybS family protein n=1 Tax=Anaeromonas frigoriresistens TaxID=2683708 RepID=A0A942US77_9FIRM|nr:YybS family protein [Anaeromonas frigoriresistens]MBS4536970.1 YybS family protein [Anaeromonas frigoriresistens]